MLSLIAPWDIFGNAVASLIRSFSKDDGDSSENVKKTTGCSTLFLYISFPSLHDCGVKIPNFTFMEDVKKRQRILLPLSKLEFGPQEINSSEIRLHLQCQRIGISATKFEKTRIHFKSEVFAAVALVDAKAPYLVL